jgi:hypothetical protein
VEAFAPGDFGRFSGDLLAGNFGDGLWALQFGHGTPANGPMNTLFFTVDPNDESDGLFSARSPHSESAAHPVVERPNPCHTRVDAHAKDGYDLVRRRHGLDGAR